MGGPLGNPAGGGAAGAGIHENGGTRNTTKVESSKAALALALAPEQQLVSLCAS